MSLKKNDVTEVTIKGMTSEGNGVGIVNNIAVFVPNTAIGDVVKIKIVKVLKRFAYGKVEKIILASKDRIQNDCPVYDKCGGCIYRHINYISEVDLKAEQVFHNMSSIGKVDFYKCDPLYNENYINGYRNKAQYPASTDINGKVKFGFYALRSHRVIANEYCKLQPDIFGDIVACVEQFLNENNIKAYDEVTHKGFIRHLYIRKTEKTDEIMVCFVVNANDFTVLNPIIKLLTSRFENIKSIVVNINTSKNNVILGKECVKI